MTGTPQVPPLCALALILATVLVFAIYCGPNVASPSTCPNPEVHSYNLTCRVTVTVPPALCLGCVGPAVNFTFRLVEFKLQFYSQWHPRAVVLRGDATEPGAETDTFTLTAYPPYAPPEGSTWLNWTSTDGLCGVDWPLPGTNVTLVVSVEAL